MTMTRRHMLIALAGASTIPLVGCATGGTTIATWITGLEAIATELNLVLPQLQAAGLGGNTLNSVQTIISEIQSALSAISSVSTQAQGQSVLVQVEIYINSLAPLVLPFVSLIPGGGVIALIIAALPAIELAINFAASLLSSTALQVAQKSTTTSGRYGGALSSQDSQRALLLLIQRANVGR